MSTFLTDAVASTVMYHCSDTNNANMDQENCAVVSKCKKYAYTKSFRTVFSYSRVIPSADALTVNTSLNKTTPSCAGNKIQFLEHVQVRVNLNYTRRGDLEMNLTSPWGTTSRLTQYRPKDNAPDATYLTNWTILTLHHWGENPSGVWRLTLKNSQLKHTNTG